MRITVRAKLIPNWLTNTSAKLQTIYGHIKHVRGTIGRKK